MIIRQNDQLVIKKISELEAGIESWAKSNNIWFDCGFQTFAHRINGEPTNPPVATILYFGSEFNTMLEGCLSGLDVEFQKILESFGFWYEQSDGVSLHFYTIEEEGKLADAFKGYFRWQWVCSLIQPDFADISNELYAYFSCNPDDLQNLSWRDFEILLFRIFQAQGFQAELGPGSGDGGIDIRILQRDPIGDILTLVQAKRYASKNKIGLEAVAALHGVAEVEKAAKSLFVTTSSYQPAAKRFAARTSGRLELHTSDDVVNWCEQASHGIIQDKSKLVSPAYVSHILYEVADSKHPRVLHAHTGVTMILNSFALVLKETQHAVLLMLLPQKTISDGGFGQTGLEVPLLNDAAFKNLKMDTVWRAKRSVDDNGRVSYWDGSNLYTQWNGQPQYFSWLD